MAEASWGDLKTQLQGDGNLPQIFRKSADEIAFDAVTSDELEPPIVIKAYTKDNSPEHQPLLLDLHLKDVSSLLDRIISYRREARELEILAVKAATDYLLFNAQSTIEAELEIARLRRKQKEQERDAQQEGAGLFGDSQPLNKGFARLALGRAQEMQTELTDIDGEIDLLSQKWDLLHKYHESYHARYQEPGNAHNFEERAVRVLTLMAEDVREAFAKAKAIATGFEMIYGEKTFPLPATNPLTFIDELVLWCRAVIRDLEVRSENEIEYDLVLPIVQPNPSTGTSLVSDADFKKALEKTVDMKGQFQIEFSLPNIFFGDDAVRLRGVGLSFGNVTNIVQSSGIDRTATADSYVRLYASIQTPEQVVPGGVPPIRRPPIRFGCVSALSSGRPLAFSDGNECQNVQPVGLWKINLMASLVYKDTKARSLSEGIEDNPLRDLKLHMKVRARPRPIL